MGTFVRKKTDEKKSRQDAQVEEKAVRLGLAVFHHSSIYMHIGTYGNTVRVGGLSWKGARVS
jgi:hypothetical protein